MLPMPAHGPPNDPRNAQKEHSAALLLVERDDGLRRFLFWSLYLEGYKVLTARDAVDALRVSRDIAGSIELLIIGSIPLASNATELQKQIESERSEVRTILLDELIRSEGGLGESLNAGTLIRRIREILADR